jgi:RimJ/RimL family protein N-acetyltransferase
MGLLELGPLGLASHVDWREGLPLMATSRIILRELRKSDAPALLRLSQSADIAPHTWAGPGTVDDVAQFIEWSRTRRVEGKSVCFAIVPRGESTVAGIFALRSLQPDFFRAEFSFFIDRPLWGTGVFADAARMVCDFAFSAIGVHRIEARAEVDNDRANGALKKIGATQEGRLRASFVREGQMVDQYLWSIVNGLDSLRVAVP